MAQEHSFSQDVNHLDLLLAEQPMTRRTALRKLAGLALVGGSITSIGTACGSPPNTLAAAPIPTPALLRTALYSYHGCAGSVSRAVWSPDGTRLALASYDGTAQVWDAANGKPIYT